MKLSKKYWRVQYKLAHRKFKSNPRYSLVAMILCASFAVGSLSYVQFKLSKEQDSFSTFTEWQSAQILDDNGRVPASLPAGFSCSYEEVSLGQIKTEVKALEKKYQTGSIIEGKFHGLDLTVLPSIGAQLLADNKSLIGDKNAQLDFTKCLDVPCVFNTIYKDESHLAGYFVYYWYLKTGSMLSLTNVIPDQMALEAGKYANKEHPYENYLFSQAELKNFYFLAKSLPEKLTFIPLMKSVHKIPLQANIENQKQSVCSVSLPNGQILLQEECLQGDKKTFFINVTKQIAKYADRHEGLKKDLNSLSSSKDWLAQSGWFKETYFNPQTHKFEYRWKATMPANQFIDKMAMISPSEQLASLIAHYRFDPENFKAKTPMEMGNWVKSNIFVDSSFDSDGLYNQYIHQSLDVWARQEVGLWRSCLDEHLKDKELATLQRDIASSLDHPLYACVENKIPAFVDFVQKKVEKEYFEGCQFFNDENHYGHMAKRFETNVQKYLLEKILQRKIEIQKHGTEVLTSQEVKDEFIATIDPKNIYIHCFDKLNAHACYNGKIKSKLNGILSHYKKFSDYYKKIVEEDILALYPFEHVQSKSNEAAKLFLAPYSARLHQAANKMWNSCKDRGIDHNMGLKLPMKFSGGRYFVNPKLINCINKNVENELTNLAGLKAFNMVSGERKAYKLNNDEQKFALSFLEGKLLQTLNNLLDEEYLAEKIRFDLHFNKARITAISNFSEDKQLLEGIFSMNQVDERCMKKVSYYYPENYYYHSRPVMDKKFGRSICAKFITLPRIKEKLKQQVAEQWENNKKLAISYLADNYQDLVDDCYSDYPVHKRGRNQRYRNICIQQSFEEASFMAIKEWRGHEHYKYFGERESEIVNHFNNRLRSSFISKANQQEPLLREPASL